MKCYSCASPAREGRTRCDRHLELAAQNTARWIERNRDEINSRRAVAYAAKPRRGRVDSFYRTRYGITYDDYLGMHAAQGGLCVICLQPERVLGNQGKVKNLSVDHDHETGRVRGLLCNNCNRSLGLLQDDPLLLARAFLYLTDGLLA